MSDLFTSNPLINVGFITTGVPVSAVLSIGGLKVYMSGSWNTKQIKIYSGSSWVAKPIKRYNGSTWVIMN